MKFECLNLHHLFEYHAQVPRDTPSGNVLLKYSTALFSGTFERQYVSPQGNDVAAAIVVPW